MPWPDGTVEPTRFVPAPIVDMVYVRTGEKRPLCPMWQRAKAKAEAKAREKAEGGNK